MNALKYSNLAVTAMPVTSAGRRITSPTPSCTSSINDSTVTNSNASTTTAKTTHTQLPADFEPSSYSVICGRGKQNFNHVGNRRFRIISGMFLERYSASTSKQERSTIVAEILVMVRHAGGKICKYQSGHWWEVAEAVAREKVGALMRDCLHTQYRSSTKAKVARRQAIREQNITPIMAPQDPPQPPHWQAPPQPQAPLERPASPQPQAVVSLSPDCYDDDDSDDSSTTSSCWECSNSLERSLDNEGDRAFEMDVF